MADQSVISMVQCPYCDKQWVREDTELVCEDCTPALKIDLAVADIASAVEQLKEIDPELLKRRRDLLISTNNALAEMLRKL